MTFRKARSITKFRTTNAKKSIENGPKIHSKSDPEAFQNSLRKNKQKKTPKKQKNLKNRLQNGVPRVSLECAFRTSWGLWAPLGAKMARKPLPRAPQTLRTSILYRFGFILNQIWHDFYCFLGSFWVKFCMIST